jgi:hypothetical protein
MVSRIRKFVAAESYPIGIVTKISVPFPGWLLRKNEPAMLRTRSWMPIKPKCPGFDTIKRLEKYDDHSNCSNLVSPFLAATAIAAAGICLMPRRLFAEDESPVQRTGLAGKTP